jgi:hypothetical protein
MEMLSNRREKTMRTGILALAVVFAASSAFAGTALYTHESDEVLLMDASPSHMIYSGGTIHLEAPPGELYNAWLFGAGYAYVQVPAGSDYTFTTVLSPGQTPTVAGGRLVLRLWYGSQSSNNNISIEWMEDGGSYVVKSAYKNDVVGVVSGSSAPVASSPLKLQIRQVGTTVYCEYSTDAKAFTVVDQYDLTDVGGVDFSVIGPVFFRIRWYVGSWDLDEVSLTGDDVPNINTGGGEGEGEGEGEPTYEVEFSPDMFDIARAATNFVSTSDDFNANGIPDIDEMGLLAAVMVGNSLYPLHSEARAAFLANANQFFSEIVALDLVDALGGEEASRYFSTGVSGLVTLGILPASAIGLGSDDGNYNASLAPALTVDYDGDGISNADEWAAAGGDRAAWIAGSLPGLPVAGLIGLGVLVALGGFGGIWVGLKRSK